MICTVTMNPSIDYYTCLQGLTAGKINRAESESIMCGGKGINVSRVLHSLGCPTRALGVSAGQTGEMIESMLAREGIEHDFIHIPDSQSRVCVKIRANGETDINGPGPELDSAAVREIADKLRVLGKDDTVVLAGSLPRGLPDNSYAQMIDVCRAHIAADTTGGKMLSLLSFRPYIIKPNEAELAEMCGTSDVRTGAYAMREAGAKNVLVSLGARGAYLLCEDGREIYSRSAPITPIDTTCAGDSMLAGFLAAVNKGADHMLAMRIATAAGTAACLRYGPAHKQDILRAAEQINVWEDNKA